MKFSFSFFVIITLCFLPIRTHSNCWEIVYSICCCYCKQEKDDSINNQIITSSNAIDQTYQATQNNVANNTYTTSTASRLSNTISSIDGFNEYPKITIKTMTTDQEMASSNSPKTYGFSPEN